MRNARRTLVVALCAVIASTLGAARLVPSAPPGAAVEPNDNQRAAGTLANGVLTVTLEARTGVWAPEGVHGPKFTVAAFADRGGPPQTPGPLLRVSVGTEVRATVHNRLAVPLWMYGLGATRGYGGDSVLIAPNASHRFRFRARAAGLFYYAGRTSTQPVVARLDDDSQLNGVIAVDTPGPTPRDRIFVISNWFTIDPKTMSGLGPDAMLAFNGLGWPHTPRIDLAQGDSVRWRFVNVSALEHPLHLHGTYFRVDSRGNGTRDSLFAVADRRLAVTELLLPGQTMAMAWAPIHSGNWILHCHIASHMSKRELFESDRRMPAGDSLTRMATHGEHLEHMAALVIGIRVTPRGAAPAAEPVDQQLRLLVRSRAKVYGDYLGYGFVLGGSPAEAVGDSLPVPGPSLEVTRGRRVAITLVNRAHEAIAVHWHGIELESFPDGVPGWSGAGNSTLPHIMPGDSLTVRFTPPRTGTFMYHSHSNEMQQISSGLYGSLIVREPGEVRDTAADRVLLFSDGGPIVSFITPPPPVLINGRERPDTMDLRAGRPTRLRLINIRTEYLTELRLEQDGQPLSWRVLAKDGAPLPAHQVHSQRAALKSGPGEIHDVEVTPTHAGVITLYYVGQPGDSTSTRKAYFRAR